MFLAGSPLPHATTAAATTAPAITANRFVFMLLPSWKTFLALDAVETYQFTKTQGTIKSGGVFRGVSSGRAGVDLCPRSLPRALFDASKSSPPRSITLVFRPCQSRHTLELPF